MKPRTNGPRTRGQTEVLAGVNEGSSDLVKRSFRYKFLYKLAQEVPKNWLTGEDPKKRKKEIEAWVKLNVELF